MALVAIWAVATCSLVDDTPTYRYRLTVEIETPEGLRIGSSVIEVETSVASSFSIPSPGSVHHPVPGGKTLFALLRSENDIDWASRMMFMLAPEEPRTDEDSFQSRFNNLLKLKGPILLPRMWPPLGGFPEQSAYPMLVTFGDLSDPTSSNGSIRTISPRASATACASSESPWR